MVLIGAVINREDKARDGSHTTGTSSCTHHCTDHVTAPMSLHHRPGRLKWNDARTNMSMLGSHDARVSG